ncbi:GNAT family N-acetyltransferase [Halomarina ordinaria]|uniref:GNAT family N-acetyltransferase n=1 Tax=Halomarina ordinaria TaxID=3033939 RepID=A0ABD5U8P4_9EURY|nr:GNAT family N-acetyltransferase [Halomarina sp. PSRA2]
MSIRVEAAGPGARRRWDDWVARAAAAMPLHYLGPLRVLERATGATLYPLVGYRGEEPVGLFPAFVTRRGPLAHVTSPPEGHGVAALGPVLLPGGTTKQRTREHRHREFVGGCLDWLDDHVSPDAVTVRTTTGYDDVRPFVWAGFEATLDYTYLLDIDRDDEALLGGMSRSLRRTLRDADEFDCEIHEGGRPAARRIVRHAVERYADLGEPYYGASPSLVADLYRAAPAGSVRAYACTVDGRVEGGLVTFEHDETVTWWQGGAKPAVSIPVNDLVTWHVVRDARDRGYTRYDLFGAGSPRTADYKSQFGPRIDRVFNLRRTSGPYRAAEELYGRVPTRALGVVGW